MSLQMPRRPRPSLIASLLAVACLGVGGGVLLSTSLSSNNDTRTVVRQVTVHDSQSASTTSPLSVNEIYRRAYKGVVELIVSNSGGAAQSQGSGFVYDSNGDVVTNQHVVAGAGSISVRFWNGNSYDAALVGTDRSTDLAVVKVSAPASVLSALALGDSSKLVVGDGVVAIGSPFGLEETVTSGIVSALHRSIDAPNNFTIPDSIQTDAAINHGNSGGPLLNAEGRVVGVNAQIRSESGDNAGVGFAIPSNAIRSVASQLISTGKAEHAYLGVTLDSASARARVAGVRSGTPADQAGIRADDVVTTFDGTEVSNSEELARAINAHKPGDTVSVTYVRDGQSHTVKLKLASRPS